jgi:hypothetical protein
MTFAHLNHDHAKTQQLPRLFRRLLRGGEKMIQVLHYLENKIPNGSGKYVLMVMILPSVNVCVGWYMVYMLKRLLRAFIIFDVC